MRELLRALWQQAHPGCVTFWFLPGRRSLHVPHQEALSLSTEDEGELTAIADDTNAYFGLALRRAGLGLHQQGGKRDCVLLPALALDVDVRVFNGVGLRYPQSEDDALTLLEGSPPPTAVVSTGRGFHFYWALTEPLPITQSSRASIEASVRAFQGGFHSRAHARGFQLDWTATVQRVWRVPGTLNRKTTPPRLVELRSCHPERRYEMSDLVRVSSVSSALNLIRSALLCRPVSATASMEAYALASGQSLAPRGQRDITLQRVASVVAWLPEAQDVPIDELAELFRPTAEIWAAEPDADKTVDQELAKVRDKLDRARRDLSEQRAVDRRRSRQVAAGLASVDPATPRAFDPRHAIIQRRSAFYVWDFGEKKYSHPLTEKELGPFIRDAWLTAPDDIELQTVRIDRHGNEVTKRKPITAILDDYCTVAIDTVGDMTVGSSSFDAVNGIFREAVAIPRKLEPHNDVRISQWLQLLSGSLFDKIQDWLACVPRLDRPLSALYLDGKSGAGKGMLAHGVARLWRKGPPTPLEHLLGDFQDAMLKCPLLWIDEALPQRRGNVSPEIRSLVGKSSFVINTKHLPPREVHGCVRLIIAANNDNVLALGDEHLSADDLEAVVGRFLHIRVPAEAAAWMAEHNRDGRLWDEWVEHDGIARHCLHLAQTRAVVPGKRFLVQGSETAMHRKLVMQGEAANLVYEWIVRFATDPARVHVVRGGTAAARIGNGEIVVTTQGIVDHWRAYIPDDVRRPSTPRIGNVLRQIAERDSQTRGFLIRAELVLEWCRLYGVGNKERIQANLERSC